MLPRFEIVRRLRPIDLVRPCTVPGLPSAASTAPVDGPTTARLGVSGMECAATYDGSAVALRVGGRVLRSRRFAAAEDPDTLAITLTGRQLTAWSHEAGAWVARARFALDEDADLEAQGAEGVFGQIGLRDVRLVSDVDGTPVRDGGLLWFTATSAGPGFFATAHTSVWSIHPESLDLEHRGDLWFRRPDLPGVYGDHATHLVRDGSQWLVATSTWGDFREPETRAARRAPSTLRVTLARSDVDLLSGTHVLDTEELPLPTDGLSSIATWDPHLVRRDGRWLVGFVSAPRFFSFHPALASGPSLADLSLTGADPTRRASEGTTLLELDGSVVVLASDGREGRRGQRAGFSIFDDSLAQVGTLDAPYPTNIPWPTLARLDDGSWLMLTFNGRQAGGRLLGYGTHGDLVVMRGPAGG